MGSDDEAFMPADMVARVLACAPENLVLIGGQALAYWMDVYGVHDKLGLAPAVSRDVDFFTPNAADTESLKGFANAIGGKAEVRSIHALSPLIGSAIAPASEGRVYNVDLLHDVMGLERQKLEANAVRVELPYDGKLLRVMHPLDLLASRNMNLHRLQDKQDEVGRSQLKLAIAVAREYLLQAIDAAYDNTQVSEEERQREVFNLIAVVSDYSTEDAAKKNAERHGIHLADAIPAWRVSAEVFWLRQWPRLRDRMSAVYVELCEDLARKSGVQPALGMP